MIHKPCCNLSTADLLKLVYNKVAAICSRQVVTCLLTPVLVRLLTTTYNKPANNARIMRDSSTMLQLVNSGLVTACLQQVAAICWRQVVTSLLTTVFASVHQDNFQQDRLAVNNLSLANLSLTNRNKTCKHIRTSACWRKAATRPGRLQTCYNFCDLCRVDLSYFMGVWIFPYLYFISIQYQNNTYFGNFG